MVRGECGCPAGQSILPVRADNNTLAELKGINHEQTAPQQTITRFYLLQMWGEWAQKPNTPQISEKYVLPNQEERLSTLSGIMAA